MGDDDEITRESAAFLEDPWTAAILKKENVEWRIVGSRRLKASNEDALMGTTLKSETTIRHCLSVYEKPTQTTTQIEQVTTLMNLGPGMDGWPQILHGGIVATIMDEAMGILITVNGIYHHKNPGRNEGPNKNMAVVGGGSFTGQLNITYKNPVKTPGLVVITTRYARREGRKDWIQAEVRQIDRSAERGDREIICATAEALFIARKSKI